MAETEPLFQVKPKGGKEKDASSEETKTHVKQLKVGAESMGRSDDMGVGHCV